MANKPQDNFTCGKSLAENGEYIGMSLKISIPSWFSALVIPARSKFWQLLTQGLREALYY